MALDPNQNHDIDPSAAGVMTKRFRDNNSSVHIGGVFGKIAVQEILNQPNCVGLRYYFAETTNSELTLVLVGVDIAGNDIVTGKIADMSLPDPPATSNPNILNS